MTRQFSTRSYSTGLSVLARLECFQAGDAASVPRLLGFADRESQLRRVDRMPLKVEECLDVAHVEPEFTGVSDEGEPPQVLVG